MTAEDIRGREETSENIKDMLAMQREHMARKYQHGSKCNKCANYSDVNTAKSLGSEVLAKEHRSAFWMSSRCHRFNRIAFHWTAAEGVTFERRDYCVILLASGLSHFSRCGMLKLPFPTGSVLPPLIHKPLIRKTPLPTIPKVSLVPLR